MLKGMGISRTLETTSWTRNCISHLWCDQPPNTQPRAKGLGTGRWPQRQQPLHGGANADTAEPGLEVVHEQRAALPRRRPWGHRAGGGLKRDGINEQISRGCLATEGFPTNEQFRAKPGTGNP